MSLKFSSKSSCGKQMTNAVGEKFAFVVAVNQLVIHFWRGVLLWVISYLYGNKATSTQSARG